MVQERANAHRHLFGTPDAPSLASASLSGEEITEELLVAATPSEMLEHTVSNLDALLGQFEEADQLHKAIKDNKRCVWLCVCACLRVVCARMVRLRTNVGITFFVGSHPPAAQGVC